MSIKIAFFLPKSMHERKKRHSFNKNELYSRKQAIKKYKLEIEKAGFYCIVAKCYRMPIVNPPFIPDLLVLVFPGFCIEGTKSFTACVK
jgi:hypothetical protein